MPVKMWNREDGKLTSSVRTSRGDSYRGERYRSDAEALDREIDRMLDRSVELLATTVTAEAQHRGFVKRWAIGRALRESGLQQSQHLDPQEKKWLWQAIARKCRLGVRSDGGSEKAWGTLIPNRESDPARIERDVFAVGLWLQEQEISKAVMAFGANRTNARELFRRGAINSKNLRDTLARWFAEMEPAQRAALTKPKNFVLLAKALAIRFPGRGPGSAKRPVHYTDEELYGAVCTVLDPISDELGVGAAQTVAVGLRPTTSTGHQGA